MNQDRVGNSCRSLLPLALLAGPAIAQAPLLTSVHRVVPRLEHNAPLQRMADLDRDGDQDVVFVGEDRLVVWLSVGGARLEIHQSDAVSFRFVRDIALGDFDGDGDLDLAIAIPAQCVDALGSCGSAPNRILWNDGTGRFGTAGPTLPFAPQAVCTSIATGDVDGDGDVDLVFGCEPHAWIVVRHPLPPLMFSENGENLLYLNDGSGNFTAANARLGTSQERTMAVLLADFDGDGDLDLFAGNSNTGTSGQDQLFHNDGTGNFAQAVGSLPAENDTCMQVRAVDVDGDGDLDLLGGSLGLLTNNGGTFAQPAVRPQLQDPWSLGDFDRDGDADVVQRFGGVLEQLRNNGAGTFVLAATYSFPGALVPIDFDGDADLDLVLPQGTYYDSTLLLNDGTGAWSEVDLHMPGDLGNKTDGAAVDIDGDGDLDVVACAENYYKVVWLNDGAGGFQESAYGDFTTDIAYSEGLAIGDLDGDGHADAAVANFVIGLGRTSLLYRNNGAGRLDRVAIPAISATCTALGDIDGDGDLDAYFGTLGNDVVLRNQGGMSFVAIPGAVNDARNTWSVTLADVDGDGDLDAIAAGYVNTANRVLLNDGAGVFTLAPAALPTVQEDTVHVEALDIDGDGDRDLVFANDGSAVPQANRLYRNAGNGTFADSSQDLPQPVGRTISFSTGDFDADGDLDLVETNFSTVAPSRLLLNDGLGHFGAAAGSLTDVSPVAHRLVPGDFDRDGDLDAFLVGQTAPALFWNMRRHLWWSELPRIARPLPMELSGPPSSPFALGVSTLRLPVGVSFGLGLLHCDPAGLVQIDLGLLDAAGHGGVTYAVPNDPQLVGARFYWQALMGNPALLTNIETTELIR